MDFRRLGQTDLQVSRIGLGTMTWGEQNSEVQAHEQLNYAFSCGVNFIDTAEMYPVPTREETYARTESYIGTWLSKQSRSDIILASKITGPSRQGKGLSYIRGGSNFTKGQIFAACEASLKRLKTDYLDLYQLHWPERDVNCFGRLGLVEIHDAPQCTPLQESLEALQSLQQQGKIRYFGLSNETPWGVMTVLRLHHEKHLPRVQSVQNPYNLLNRSYEVGLAEISLREQIDLLAYSPMAFGLLSGKYRRRPWPSEARLSKFPQFQRYLKPQAFVAAERYADIADQAGLSLATMALAFVSQRPFIGSNIIGATTMAQLKENIATAEVVLSDDTLAAIDAVHADISNPCP